MAKYLIEVPHSSETVSCLKTIKIFMETGSHYLVNADWGCPDGVHSSWMIVDAKDKDEARNIVPPAYRREANIISLGRFTLDQVENLLKVHTAPK